MNIKLFLDLDGVLADFDGKVVELLGSRPSEINDKEMWPKLAKYKNFFGSLDWTNDGNVLWEYTKNMNPVILTGCPRGNWAKPQKLDWCRRNLGDEIDVITCFSREKPEKALEITNENETPILIDDRKSIKEKWEEMGGIFIHHTSSVNSIRELNNIIGKGF